MRCFSGYWLPASVRIQLLETTLISLLIESLLITVIAISGFLASVPLT
jgi:hypothetical protein